MQLKFLSNFKWPMASAVLVAAVVGCNSRHGDRDDHGHDHAPTSTQITVWGEHHEVFIEHPPLIAGDPVTFAVHVTELRTWEPRTDGPLGFRFRQAGGASVTHLEPEPTQPGLYLPSLTFPHAGDWQVTVLLPDANVDASLQLPSVRVHADAHAAAHAPLPVAPAGIALRKEQQWMLGLETQLLGRRELTERVALPAQVQAKPGYRATVIAPVAGQVQVPVGGTLPLPGHRVESGQVLVLLRPMFSDAAVTLAEVQAGLARSEAALVQAEAAFDRVTKLAAEQARSQREVEESAWSLAVARANHRAAAALQSTYGATEITSLDQAPGGMPDMELRAPIAGFIDSLAAGLGEPVEAGQKLFTLLDPAILWIEARIPEATIARFTSAKGATYELPGARHEFMDIMEAGGNLVFTGLQVDPVTRTVPLVYEVPNPAGALRIGQTLTLHVATDGVADALVVPESAIVEEANQPIAFVQVAGETFEKRYLALGIRDSGWVEVRGGLMEGERVVTRGAFAVRLASVSAALPTHGHAH